MSEHADLVLHNGRVLTMAAERPTAEAVAVRDARILAVGSDAEVRALVGPRTETIDVRGQVVLPGFIDSHNHVLWTGMGAVRFSLDTARSVDEVLDLVRRQAAGKPAGEWVVSSLNWRTAALREGRYPTRQELDAAAPEHPVYLPSNGHSAAVNSLALRLAGIDADTDDPPGGRIEREADSREPGGVLREQPALWLVERLLPPLGPAEYARAIQAAAQPLLAAGITSVIDPGLTPAEMRGYHDLWQRGALPLRTTMMLRADWEPDAAAARRLLDAWGVASGFGDAWLRLGGIKLFIDGGISYRGSLMEEPYADAPGHYGNTVIEPDDLREIVCHAHALGWQVGIHVSGDRAVRMALDAFEAAHRQRPITDQRFQLIHAHQAQEADWGRAREMGVVIVPQPSAIPRGTWADRLFGPRRANRMWPLRGFLDAGLLVAGSSDAPVYPHQPLVGMWSAVVRRLEGSDQVIGPDQRITRREALELFTINGARATSEEHLKGTLDPGKLADLAVLADDPLTCAEDALKDVEVTMTLAGGKVAYRA
jgi:predicted amidohydrolase YtcJ